jgi:GntR family transcriptional regulator
MKATIVGDAVDCTAGAGAVMSRLTVHVHKTATPSQWAGGPTRGVASPSHPRTLTRATAIEEVDTGPGGAYARLEEAGHVIASFVEHVGARMPTPDEVTTLQLDEGTPVITVTRVAYGPGGTPLELNDIVLAANVCEVSYECLAD